MSQPDIVFFDGGCGLCHRAVRHALRHDRGRDQFRFAPLVGPTADEVLDEAFRRDPPDSLVVVTPEGEHLLRSSAVIRILKRLG
ncbi:MAG: DUF393 domain-containing protein, partial [Planctomycetes bacterium]|nr:DUF393 domain-containing protein [Planctomycetota bacterium]